MRIVCISDTHSQHRRISVPEGDLLLCAGDICMRGLLDEVTEFDDWLATLPHPHKVLIAGNHDWCFQRQPEQAQALLHNCHYLMDEAVTVAGVKIYGSPWQPEFFDWAFNLPRGEELRQKWDLIPEDSQIVVTHGPPWGILDRTSRGVTAGCEELAPRIRQIRPRLHLFGHIHEAYGQQQMEDTLYVNASCCDRKYRPIQPPVVVDWPAP